MFWSLMTRETPEIQVQGEAGLWEGAQISCAGVDIDMSREIRCVSCLLSRFC